MVILYTKKLLRWYILIEDIEVKSGKISKIWMIVFYQHRKHQ